MSGMLEKIARDMHHHACAPYGSKEPAIGSWEVQGWLYKNLARAALMAMRVPDPATMEAAEFSADNTWDRDNFTAMIDAILNEPE